MIDVRPPSRPVLPRMRRQLAVPLALAALAVGGARPAAAQNPAAVPPAGGPPQLGRAPLRDVVAALTDSEKVRLVVGTGIILPAEMGAGPGASMFPPAMRGPAPTADDSATRVPGAAGSTHAVRRLGIPSIVVSDGPAGVRIDPIRRGPDGRPDSSRTYYATAFPVGTLLASSWDTALVRRVGVAFGEEVRDYGVDVLLGPGMNIHRNPLGGRNFEYYSEDPLVTGSMAAAIVDGIQSNGVGTSIKHFAANEQEFNRMRLNSAVGERALRELYLKGFQIAVRRAQPWTVMSSYNLVNGTHTAESRELLTDLLRGEFGFRGLVMSDWFGGEDPAAMVNAGNDLVMPGTGGQEQALRAALAAGTLSRAALDSSVTRVLALVLKSPTFRGVPHSDRPDLRAHAAVARTAAAESMVLLRDQAFGGSAARRALPLAAGSAVAVFGNTSYDLIAGGTGSGNVNRAYTVSLTDGLAGAGMRVDSSLAGAYRGYLAAERARAPKRTLMQDLFAPRPVIAELAPDPAAVRQAAERDAAAVVTLGRIAGEGLDRKVADDFELRAPERALLRQVSAAFHARRKPVVVVLNVGGPVEVVSWRDQADAILLAWQPGQEGGHAIADVLGGRVNPSGKLATTFPARYADVPYGADFPGRVRADAPPAASPLAGRASENTYAEGIYVGYRYYRTFGRAPAYAFGHGLSYTTFRYGGPRLSGVPNGAADSITVTATVTNTGRVAGREVAELYVSAPSTAALPKPERELRAFAKTGVLPPGRSETVTFRLGAADLASFDPAQSAWVADAGTYTVRVAGSSADDGVRGTFALPQRIVTERSRPLLAPRAPVAELKAAAR
ncbi:glycosyl hydrolase [Gemmatimonadetes bacterium T265]|nr:glycosyl hydrolase [Gemmatimonadetes bacterium T265]